MARHGTRSSSPPSTRAPRSEAHRRAGTGAAAVAGIACALLVGCGHTARDSSFFVMRPITGRTSPPCVAPALGRTSTPDGAVVACYELGPSALDAHDVKSAVVRPEPNAKTAAVEFELTLAGTQRFNALARSVGVGGQAAVVVDGAIVSVPRLETSDSQGAGVVTGLEPSAAGRLASRLGHG